MEDRPEERRTMEALTSPFYQALGLHPFEATA